MVKALIIGLNGFESHDLTVREYFLFNAPANSQCDIVAIGFGTPNPPIVAYMSNVSSAVQYAINNGYNYIIRTYTGVWSYRLEWDYAYQYGVQVVHGHGSNIYVELAYPPQLFSAVTCGGGITQNERSYGNGLEFYDVTNDNRTEESYTTAVIAAKLATIKEALNCSHWESRYRARMTATNNGQWNKYDGYGKINIQQAIAWTGTIPQDPYDEFPKPVVMYSTNGRIELLWNSIATADCYKIYRNNELIATTAENQYYDSQANFGKVNRYKVVAYNQSQQSESDEVVVLPTIIETHNIYSHIMT